MTAKTPSATLNAWLTTIASDGEGAGEMHTLLPPAGSQQPLLASFQSFRNTNSAAPLDVQETLAEGSMGIVKIAEQSALGRISRSWASAFMFGTQGLESMPTGWWAPRNACSGRGYACVAALASAMAWFVRGTIQPA